MIDKIYKLKIKDNVFFLPFLFLFSFFVVSDFARSRFGYDMSFIFVLILNLIYLFKIKIFKLNNLFFSFTYLTFIPILHSLFGKDLIHVIASILITYLPFTLDTIISYKATSNKISYYIIFALSSIILFLWINFGFLKYWNPNCMAYLLYFGISTACIIISDNRKNLFSWLIYILIAINLLATDSRNIALALIITILLLVFKEAIGKKIIYRITYITAILYPFLFPKIAKFIQSNKYLYNLLLELTIKYFNKYQVFSGRTQIFDGAEKLLHDSFFDYLFGHSETMVSFYAGHNNYYTCMYFYGLFGTIIIGLLFINLFEKAYELISNGDNIVYGCFCILIGMFIQLGSEGYFIAMWLLTLMPFIYIAIIIKRYREYTESMKRDINYENDDQHIFQI